MYRKLLEIENNINKKNEGYFTICMYTVGLERLLRHSERKLFTMDIEEHLISLRTNDITKLLKKDEKISYNFSLDNSKEIEELKYYLLKEIAHEYNKELGL